jgi:hypothetical protein
MRERGQGGELGTRGIRKGRERRCYKSNLAASGRSPHRVNAPYSWDSGPAYLSSPLSHAFSSELSVTFIHALGCEVAELMGNASQQRLKIPEHKGRQINSPGLQTGEGEFRLVRMKGLAHFQEFGLFENDNGQAFIGVRGVTKIVV